MSYFDSLKSKLSGVPSPDNSSPEAVTSVESHDNTKVDIEPTEKKEVVKTPLIVPKEEKQFFLSQSLIKEVTDQHGNFKEVCPRVVYEKFITKKYREMSMPMLQGIFGETLILGSGARGQSVTDLPRHKRTGEKLIDQKRIEEQALRTPIWIAEKMMSIIPGVNTQIPITKRYKGNILFRTEIDIFPTPFLDDDGKLKYAVVDLKMTGDVNAEFGYSPWGAPQFVDHCQADATYWLLQDFDMELNLKFNPEKEEIYKMIFENKSLIKAIENEDVIFVYFIIGYKKEPLDQQIAFIQRLYRDESGSDLRQREFHERVRKTIAQLKQWHEEGWKPMQNDKCSSCPVLTKNGGYCDQGNSIKKI